MTQAAVLDAESVFDVVASRSSAADAGDDEAEGADGDDADEPAQVGGSFVGDPRSDEIRSWVLE